MKLCENCDTKIIKCDYCEKNINKKLLCYFNEKISYHFCNQKCLNEFKNIRLPYKTLLTRVMIK